MSVSSENPVPRFAFHKCNLCCYSSGGSGSGFDELGDFVSAADLATPFNERPRVIARKMVRLIINRAIKKAIPEPFKPERDTWWGPCTRCVQLTRSARKRLI